MAEEVRFELTELLHSAVFKTAALNHSATLPLFTTWLYSTLVSDFQMLTAAIIHLYGFSAGLCQVFFHSV